MKISMECATSVHTLGETVVTTVTWASAYQSQLTVEDNRTGNSTVEPRSFHCMAYPCSHMPFLIKLPPVHSARIRPLHLTVSLDCVPRVCVCTYVPRVCVYAYVPWVCVCAYVPCVCVCICATGLCVCAYVPRVCVEV